MLFSELIALFLFGSSRNDGMDPLVQKSERGMNWTVESRTAGEAIAEGLLLVDL